MQIPLQISYRGFAGTEAIEADIRARADELDRFYGRIMGCRVVVETLHRHHHKGTLYHIRIDLTVPGAELVVKRDPAEHHAHEDIHLAIHDAFDAARRMLEDHARRVRDDTKTHAVPMHGTVLRLLPDYGFIGTPDGGEVYFHRNSVVGADYDKLEAGAEVRFHMHEGEGEKGPQASTVTPIGKHHLPGVERM
ncbi:MAG: HPF/RaiA family ribosome-associated protein [Rhodospirillales bacterium]|nr:HPF/RaiA family ribosome-associated protein [Rhodospirillales bacterium]